MITTRFPVVVGTLPQPNAPQIIHDSSARVTSNYTYIYIFTPNFSFEIFLPSKRWASMEFEILYFIQDWYHTWTPGASEGNTLNTCATHSEDCKVGTEDWLVQNSELSKDFNFVNYYSARNKFERFRGFLELFCMFEFDFRRRFYFF